MVIVWRLRGNIIRTALCWIVWHNVYSLIWAVLTGQTDWVCHPYAVHRGGCLELYCCNMVEWFWWDSSLISTTNWFPSVLWHYWFGHLACKTHPRNDLQCVEWDVKPLHYYWAGLICSTHQYNCRQYEWFLVWDVIAIVILSFCHRTIII